MNEYDRLMNVMGVVGVIVLIGLIGIAIFVGGQ